MCACTRSIPARRTAGAGPSAPRGAATLRVPAGERRGARPRPATRLRGRRPSATRTPAVPSRPTSRPPRGRRRPAGRRRCRGCESAAGRGAPARPGPGGREAGGAIGRIRVGRQGGRLGGGTIAELLAGGSGSRRQRGRHRFAPGLQRRQGSFPTGAAARDDWQRLRRVLQFPRGLPTWRPIGARVATVRGVAPAWPTSAPAGGRRASVRRRYRLRVREPSTRGAGPRGA